MHSMCTAFCCCYKMSDAHLYCIVCPLPTRAASTRIFAFLTSALSGNQQTKRKACNQTYSPPQLPIYHNKTITDTGTGFNHYPKGALTRHPRGRRWYGLQPSCALREGTNGTASVGGAAPAVRWQERRTFPLLLSSLAVLQNWSCAVRIDSGYPASNSRPFRYLRGRKTP